MTPTTRNGKEAEIMVDRLSPIDASFLHMEEDGVSQMHIGAVAVFEGPLPPFADVLNMIEGKLHLVERYRQVVRPVPLDLGRPVWVDDEHFNLEYHIRRTALPSPGGDTELQNLVARVMSQTLDRRRPLWETWVVEGLRQKRWAMIFKTHHAMVDGVGGTDLMSVMMDLGPETSTSAVVPWKPRRAPSSTSIAVSAMAEMARSGAEQLRSVRALTRGPRQVVQQFTEVLTGAASMRGLARPTAPSTLNGPIGPDRRYTWASTTVDDVKTIRKAFGGTFNDVVLAATTGGFRALLLSRGESVDRTVRTVVPVSVRARDDSGHHVGDGTLANKVSAMFAELPVNVSDPVERLALISAQMDNLKESKQAVAAEALLSLSGFAPPVLLAMGTRIALRTPQRNINTLTSNVPGPQFPLYAVGRKMVQIYPYATVANQMRIAVTMFSYNGQVNFGLGGDYDTVPDLHVLKNGIEDSMKEMVAAC